MQELERDVLSYLRERGWDDLRPADLAKSICIEAAELLEHFQWANHSLAEVKANKEKLAEIEKELADVLIYALDMAVLLELDTKRIIREKLAHISKKYPPHLVKARNDKEPGTDEAYLRIKKQYRAGLKQE